MTDGGLGPLASGIGGQFNGRCKGRFQGYFYEYVGPGRFAFLRPDAPVMRFDDTTAYGQTQSEAPAAQGNRVLTTF